MDFSHALILALLVAWGISQAVSFAIQARTLLKIHEEVNQTRYTTLLDKPAVAHDSQIALETAVEILRQLKAKA